jgi:hypothetical protein
MMKEIDRRTRHEDWRAKRIALSVARNLVIK